MTNTTSGGKYSLLPPSTVLSSPSRQQQQQQQRSTKLRKNLHFHPTQRHQQQHYHHHHYYHSSSNHHHQQPHPWKQHHPPPTPICSLSRTAWLCLALLSVSIIQQLYVSRRIYHHHSSPSGLLSSSSSDVVADLLMPPPFESSLTTTTTTSSIDEWHVAPLHRNDEDKDDDTTTESSSLFRDNDNSNLPSNDEGTSTTSNQRRVHTTDSTFVVTTADATVDDEAGRNGAVVVTSTTMPHSPPPRIVFWRIDDDTDGHSFYTNNNHDDGRGRRIWVEPMSSLEEATTAIADADTHDDESQQQHNSECVPMAAWQTQSFPVCNVLHEIAMNDDSDAHQQQQQQQLSLLSMQGSWRSVWKLQRTFPSQHAQQSSRRADRQPSKTSKSVLDDDDFDDQGMKSSVPSSTAAEIVVLKLLKSHRDFNWESYEQHRIDALAMERLTKSPFVVDIYGYCGQSVLSEYAAGNARTFIKNETLSSYDRLVMGRNLAQALTDVHSIDYPHATNITLTHNDMNMANLVEVNGRIKLNDFNIGIVQRWNQTTTSTTNTNYSTICRTPVLFAAPLWKSPEEIANQTGGIMAPPADVYGLGNLLFQVLTKRQPWTHLEPNGPLHKDIVAQRKLQHQFPHVPPKYSALSNTTILPYAALHYAVMACFQPMPQHRPTAYQITQRLSTVIHWIDSRDRSITPKDLAKLWRMNMKT